LTDPLRERLAQILHANLTFMHMTLVAPGARGKVTALQVDWMVRDLDNHNHDLLRGKGLGLSTFLSVVT
jgi:hypothetical protein